MHNQQKGVCDTERMNQPVSSKAHDHIAYFDILRILAAFAIVMLHVAAWHWSSLDYQTVTWKIHHFYNGATRWAVPVFVMMSGSLFLDPSRPLMIKRLYRKNILRLLVTYVVWSAFYAFITVLKTGGFSITYLLGQLIRGHYHLWFLIMLISLYVLAPFFRKVTEDKQLLKYGILTGLVLIFLVPYALQVIALSGMDALKKMGTSLSEVFSSTVFSSSLAYVFYFVLGYYLNAAVLAKKQRILCYLGAVVGFSLTFLLTMLASAQNQMPTGDYYAPETLNVLLMSTGVFVFGKYGLSRLQFSGKAQAVAGSLSKCGLTIYLIHVFVMDTIFATGLTSLSFHPIISIPVLSLIIFLLSLCIAVAIEWMKIMCAYLMKRK